MTEPTKSLADCVRDGMHYLEQERFDEALQNFRQRETSETYLIPYGIATALFRRGMKQDTLFVPAIDEILSLYGQAIAMDPHEPSPYLMAGYAYIKKAGLMYELLEKTRELDFFVASVTALDNAEKYLTKAGEFNPYFRREVETLLPTIAEKRAAAQKLFN